MSRKQSIFFILFVLSTTVIIQLSSSKKTQRYTAYYEEPCGRSLLVLETPGEESVAVQAKGVNPIHELNHSVLVNVKLNIRGYFTGRHIDDHHCGNYPEFYVTEYSAAGPVTRCSSVSDWVMYETVILYPSGLPRNKFIKQDYEEHRSLLHEVPLSQCRTVDKNTVCDTGELPANVCGQPMNWCCKK